VQRGRGRQVCASHSVHRDPSMRDWPRSGFGPGGLISKASQIVQRDAVELVISRGMLLVRRGVIATTHARSTILGGSQRHVECRRDRVTHLPMAIRRVGDRVEFFCGMTAPSRSWCEEHRLYVDEAFARWIAAEAKTPKSDAVIRAIGAVFDEWRRGQTNVGKHFDRMK
jgi:hypothetical protein